MANGDFKPADLQSLYQELRTYHNPKRAHQLREDGLYDQDTAWARASVPSDIPIFQSSLATDVTDQISDQLRTDEPIVRLRPTGNSEDARNLVTLLTRWALQDIRDSQIRGEVDPYSQAGRDLPLRGEAVLKRLHNPDLPLKPSRTDFSSDSDHKEAVAQWETKMRTSWPLLPARPIDPLNIFLPPNATWPFPYLIEYQERRQSNMWTDYPEWKAAAKNQKVPRLKRKLNTRELENPAREVELLHFWSESHHVVEADGVEVLSITNPYGFVPYSHAYSGLGRNDVDSNPAQKAVGILRKMIGELEADVMLRTLTFALAQYYVFPRVLVPMGAAQRVAEQMRVRGIIEYENSPGEITWLVSPPVTPQVAEFLAQTQAAVARRVNPVQRGAALTPATSGVHEALTLVQSDTAISDIRNALNQMVTQSIIMGARIMEALGLTANVIGGADRDGRVQDRIADGEDGDFDFPTFEVEFKAIDPIEDTRQQQAGLRLYEGGAITLKTLHEKYMTRVVDDPEDEGIQRMLETSEAAWLGSDEFRIWSVRQWMGSERTQEIIDGTGGASPPPPPPPAFGGGPPAPLAASNGAAGEIPAGVTNQIDQTIEATGANPLAASEGVARRQAGAQGFLPNA
jgi:hypothetical protein